MLAKYSPDDIFNCDETGLFYRLLPNRTTCFKWEKPHGDHNHGKKDRMTAFLVCNLTGTYKMKPAVIGKAKKPHCLKRDYNMTVKDMAVYYYANKTAWMSTECFNDVMTMLNNHMKKQGRHILMTMDNANVHETDDEKFSNIKFFFLPPRTTSVLQPLDQGIIRSFKCRYRSKLCRKYFAAIERDTDNKTMQNMLNTLNVKIATDMMRESWDSIPASLIKNCFIKAGFADKEEECVVPDKEVEEETVPERLWENLRAASGAPDSMTFEDYATGDDDETTSKLLTQDDVVEMVNEHFAPSAAEEEEEAEEVAEFGSLEKRGVLTFNNSHQALLACDGLKAFLQRIGQKQQHVVQLERQIINIQTELCSRQVNVADFFSLKNPGQLLRSVSNASTISNIAEDKEVPFNRAVSFDDGSDRSDLDTTIDAADLTSNLSSDTMRIEDLTNDTTLESADETANTDVISFNPRKTTPVTTITSMENRVTLPITVDPNAAVTTITTGEGVVILELDPDTPAAATDNPAGVEVVADFTQDITSTTTSGLDNVLDDTDDVISFPKQSGCFVERVFEDGGEALLLSGSNLEDVELVGSLADEDADEEESLHLHLDGDDLDVTVKETSTAAERRVSTGRGRGRGRGRASPSTAPPAGRRVSTGRGRGRGRGRASPLTAPPAGRRVSTGRGRGNGVVDAPGTAPAKGPLAVSTPKRESLKDILKRKAEDDLCSPKPSKVSRKSINFVK